MQMQIKEYAENLVREGYVCPEYARKIAASETKYDLFRIMCDVNGGERLFELHAKGVPVYKDVILSGFGKYVNGNISVCYPQGYTSKFYCGYSGDTAVADTTVLYVFESDMSIDVPENMFPMVFISSGSVVRVHLCDNARIQIYVFGDGEYCLSGDTGHVSVNVKRS